MPYLLMERTFEEPLSESALDQMFQRLGPCLEQHAIEWLRSYLSADRRRMICTFKAADAESVRMAYRTAGYSFEQVWQATVLPTDEGLAPPRAEVSSRQ